MTGEFVNVGVVLYSATTGFVGAKCSTAATRLRRMFGAVDGEHIRSVLDYIERRARHLDRSSGTILIFSDQKETAATYAERILPSDDSSLQLSPVAGGVAADPAQQLEAIFERYVGRYVKARRPLSRQDEDVLPVFRKPLEERQLSAFVRPKLIESPHYEHEFPLAWQNGVWNTCDAVSFDLQGGTDILEKANKWLGRARNLFESKEPFRLILLIGEPRRPELIETSMTAERIIRKAEEDGEVILIREREARTLADMVERDVAH